MCLQNECDKFAKWLHSGKGNLCQLTIFIYQMLISNFCTVNCCLVMLNTIIDLFIYSQSNTSSTLNLEVLHVELVAKELNHFGVIAGLFRPEKGVASVQHLVMHASFRLE